MPLSRLSERSRTRVLEVWLAVFTLLTVYVLVQASSLSEANRTRITEIQESRVASCRQTYEGIRDVFRPFFRPIKERTAEEQADIDKFNDAVDQRKAACAQQTARRKP